MGNESREELDKLIAEGKATSKRADEALSEMTRLGDMAAESRAADDGRRAADDERRVADDDRRGADDERRAADDVRRGPTPSPESQNPT